MSEAKRQTELDLLRLLATLAVIAIHSVKISAPFGIVPLVWSVPVFFMISGRFFLDPQREITIEKLLRKTIPHIVTVVIFWNAAFTAYYVLSGSYEGLNKFGVLTEFILGPYHLWFLYTLMGLYLLTPILRKIAADDKALIYTLLLFAAVNIITQYLIYLPKVGHVIDELISDIGLKTVTGYMGYYLLGYFYYRKKDAIGKKTENVIYFIGIIMFCLTAVAECLISQELEETDFVKQYMKPNVILYSAAIYMFFIKRVSEWKFTEKARHVFTKLTEYGFGIYCIHALLNELIATPHFPALPIISAILRVILLYLLSLLCTWLIRKIPFIGKRIT